ncbi:hypothetical protein [Sphingobacterium faecium]|uniref:hypothetical protein n=1 Tax=Sphingobacterium faecium TaxID=34087 RepID=UPI002469011B|nr:hypothetical protein [Sphingobacterium faecium]MDH5826501.1 hypothetical protein [Sphingobacterium faecium]
MKALTLFLIVFFSFCAFGQSQKQLTDELNMILKDELVRGKEYSIRFYKFGNGKINFITPNSTKDDALLPKIETVLKGDSLLPSENSYFLHIYWDLYSTKVYTSIGKLVSEGFPNYSNYMASPYKGIGPFVKNIVTDLKRNNFDFQNYSKYLHKLEVYVDKKGYHSFIGSEKILSYLDSTKLIRWRTAAYYGKPIKSIYSIILINPHPLSDSLKRIEFEKSPEVFVWDELYENQQLRFQSGIKQIPEGKIIISFVLNTSVNSFENPIIHRGKQDEAKKLINFISKQHPLKNSFYWSEYP